MLFYLIKSVQCRNVTTHICFVPHLVHLFNVVLWHIYNIISITEWNKCGYNYYEYVYYAAVMSMSQNCYHNITNYDNIFV